MNDTPPGPQQVAVITGAGSGVGAACAIRFAKAGFRVAILDRDSANADAVADGLDTDRDVVCALAADVTDSATVAAAVDVVAHRWGRIDVVVNNAGVPHHATAFEELSDEAWSTSFDVNVRGIARVTAAALPMLKEQRGAVVNVTSVAGVRARAGLAAYCAAKAAAISLTQTLALELAPFGIRVNSIGPGALDTPMFGGFLPSDESVSDGVARYATAIPLGRLGAPEEIADAVFWAAGDQAGFMTGQTIVIDGGRAL